MDAVYDGTNLPRKDLRHWNSHASTRHSRLLEAELRWVANQTGVTPTTAKSIEAKVDQVSIRIYIKTLSNKKKLADTNNKNINKI